MNEQRIRQRNYKALLTEGSLFFTGMAFIDVNAVIPIFIFAYTQSVLLAGLATTINFAASIVLQIVVGPYVKGIRNMPVYITRIMFLFRPLPFFMIPLLFLSTSPWLTAGAFLVLYTLLCAGDGLIMVPWTDLFSRTISADKRGLLLGYQQLVGSIGALLAGLVVKTVLDNPNLVNDQRYAIIFGGAGAALTLSAVAMSFSRDVPRQIEANRPNHRQYYKALPYYFRRHPDFIQVVVIRILSFIAAMIAPFIIIYGQNQMKLPPETVSTLIYVQIIGGLLGGVILGRVSRRFGNYRVIQLTQVLGFVLAAAMAVLSLLRQENLTPYLLWPLILVNGINMSSWIGFMNHTIDIVSDEERTIYLLISNLVASPFSVLPFLAGLVVSRFGYLPVFAASALAALAAVWQAFRLKPPPARAHHPECNKADHDAEPM